MIHFFCQVLVLNNISACHIVLGNYSECDRCLEEAFENVGSAETYINAVVSARLQNKSSEIIDTYVGSLRSLDPNHPWLVEKARKEAEFDKAAKSFA